MALKQIILRKKLEHKRASLSELTATDAGFVTRAEEIETALGESVTDEDIATVSEAADALENEQNEHNSKKEALEGEIRDIEQELAELDKKSEIPQKAERSQSARERSTTPMNGYYAGMTRGEIRYLKRSSERAKMEELLKREDVSAFFEAVRDIGLKKRGITNGDLLIPNTVIDRIQIIMGDFGNVFNEVDIVRIKGTIRVVLDGANPKGIWVEMCEPIEQINASFQAVELDGFKVGGFIPVCKALMEDSMINLAMYVIRKIAIAIVKAVDDAIMNGKGASAKEPVGIIPSINDENKVVLVENFIGGVFGNLFSHMGKIDTGENEVGEIIAVMRRATYYADVAPRLVHVNAAGTYTVPNITQPNLAGLRVVFSQNVPIHNAVIGDFEKYLLLERAGTQLASSEHVRFIEDQVVLKGTARYDGKPVNVDATGKTKDFLLVEFPEINGSGFALEDISFTDDDSNESGESSVNP